MFRLWECISHRATRAGDACFAADPGGCASSKRPDIVFAPGMVADYRQAEFETSYCEREACCLADS